MRHRLRSHLTYANVMVTILAFIVLGGTAVAATGGNFILGKSNSASTATQLSSGAGNALKVTDTNGGTGVYASGGNHSKNTAAVHGQSGAGNALEGFSTANPASGVFGQDNNANSYGVAGHSDNGVAVVGDSSNGWAMQALGTTTQTRTGNGFVKAMAFIDPFFDSTDPIQQCFNSQRPPSQATSGNCGITFSGTGGSYSVGFPFEVDDRFVSVTAAQTDSSPGLANRIMTAWPSSNTPNLLKVTAFASSTGTFGGTPFYIVVY
jgi:hypothetical protein